MTAPAPAVELIPTPPDLADARRIGHIRRLLGFTDDYVDEQLDRLIRHHMAFYKFDENAAAIIREILVMDRRCP